MRAAFVGKYPTMAAAFDELAAEGVVAIEGTIPAEAITAIKQFLPGEGF